MSTLTSAINVQVNAEDKEKATLILKDLGINMSTFVNMAIKQVIKREGLPFEVVSNPSPKKELLEALKEGEEILSGKKKVKGYHNVEKMFDEIIDED